MTQSIHIFLLYIVFFLGSPPLQLFAQPDIQEQVHIHTDKDLYLNGEMVWIKIYVRDTRFFLPTNLSKIVLLELWDENGTIHQQSKALLQDGMGEAHWTLPSDLSTARYLIRAYTKWMANGPSSSFCHQAILVVNPNSPLPLQEAQAIDPSPDNPDPSSPSPPESLDIVLTCQQQAETGEEIVIEIESKTSDGQAVPAHISLSVALQLPTSSLLSSPIQFSPRADDQQEGVLPDLFGIGVHGTLTNQQGRKATGGRVVLSLPGKIPFVRISRTNAEGRFSFLLDNIYGNREIMIGAVDSTGTLARIQLDADILGDVPYFLTPFSFSPQDLPWIQDYLVHAQLQQAYQHHFAPQSLTSIPSLQSFYGQPNRMYELGEYTRFDTEETFHEILYSVSLKKKHEQFSFRVLDEYNSALMERDPLVMVDGVPINDANKLIDLPSKMIERIEVVTAYYYLNGEKLQGIIHAVTEEGDAQSVSFPQSYLRRPYAFLSPPAQYSGVKGEESSTGNGRLPDMRSLLCWEPHIQTNDQGRAVIRFRTSDLPGNFQIRAKGMSHTGQWGESEAPLSVQFTHKQ
ncbi:MAG: hypothetical protein AAF587_13715 [Bacteroidota bacterium]